MKSGPCFITAPITLDKMGIINSMVLLLECVLNAPRATKLGALLCSGPLMEWCNPPQALLINCPNLTGTLWGGRCCPKDSTASFFFFIN